MGGSKGEKQRGYRRGTFCGQSGSHFRHDSKKNLWWTFFPPRLFFVSNFTGLLRHLRRMKTTPNLIPRNVTSASTVPFICEYYPPTKYIYLDKQPRNEFGKRDVQHTLTYSSLARQPQCSLRTFRHGMLVTLVISTRSSTSGLIIHYIGVTAWTRAHGGECELQSKSGVCLDVGRMQPCNSATLQVAVDPGWSLSGSLQHDYFSWSDPFLSKHPPRWVHAMSV